MNRMRIRHAVGWQQRCGSLLMLVAAGLAGCDKNGEVRPPPAPAVVSDPQWVSQKAPRAATAVVFVHGLFGDTLDTWKNANGTSFFEHLKALPEVGEQVDVYAFGFSSRVFGSGSLDVRTAANKLQQYLLNDGVLDYPSVVFVAHSMGGLVVLRHLIGHPEVALKTPLVVLYATPQEGSHMAALGRLASANPALSQLLPADHNSFLQQLDEDWKRLPRQTRPEVVCGFETRPVGPASVVPWSSATRLCDVTAEAIEDSDHFSLVKPDRPRHGAVVVLGNALKRRVVGQDFRPRLDLPDFITEGEESVVTMTTHKRSVRIVNPGRGKLLLTVAEISDESLFISPPDTPREIAPLSRLDLTLALLVGAASPEYRFVLRSDALPAERIVRVRVPALQTIRDGQALEARAAAEAISRRLADPATAASLGGMTAEDPRALSLTAEAALEALGPDAAGLPPAVRWVLTADALVAANLPRVAATALRRAEAESQATAQSGAAQRLAGIVAAQSGEPKVFQTVPNPPPWRLPKDESPWFKADQTELADRLATQLQAVPALRAEGFVLAGDVLSAKQQYGAATEAYERAAGVRALPATESRLNEMQKFKTVPKLPTPLGASPSGPGRAWQDYKPPPEPITPQRIDLGRPPPPRP